MLRAGEHHWAERVGARAGWVDETHRRAGAQFRWRNAYRIARGLLAAAWCGMTPVGLVQGSGFDRPVGDPQQSRSAVVAKHGIVATS